MPLTFEELSERERWVVSVWGAEVWEAIRPHDSSPDEDGYYDSTGECWKDAHKYEASDTDEVLKLIDDTLRR